MPATIILELLTEALRLANNLLEGTPIEQRKAQAIAAFWTTWPVAKLFLKKEQQDQIEAVMKQLTGGGA